MSYLPDVANSESNGDVYLTRRRGDAEEDAEKKLESQNLRTRRKRRDVGWRHRPYTQVGVHVGERQDLLARAPEDEQNQPSIVADASLRSTSISAVSAVSGFDCLNGVLRVFLRASASPRQTYRRFGSVLAQEVRP